jgi:filamentous hemagglutinin family protein
MNKISLASLAALLCLAPGAQANPVLGSVSVGDPVLSSAAGTLTINQSSATSIINWNTFNIGGDESTIFQFNGAAGANSAALNLVNAAAGSSTIAGILRSTVGPGGPVGGTVMILNPAGILFTPTAQINVGSLVASTLDLSDQNDFMNRTTLHFNGGPNGAIQNQSANFNALGDIFLIAQTVQNSGTLTAGHAVGLAAGTSVTLMQSGMERLTVVAGTRGSDIGVDNTAQGKINAVVTELKAAGGNIYSLAINNSGLVRATSLVNENGRIFFRATDSASGNLGKISSTGTVKVDGLGGAAANADVTMQGGQVTLGGSVNAGAGSVSVATAYGSGENVNGNIHLNDNATIAGSSVSLHSGTDGKGDITFGSGVTVQADQQSYKAGIGDGSRSTAVVDLRGNNPTFAGSGGNFSPVVFTYAQDATIADASIPAASQFPLNIPPSLYNISSEGGNLTLATGAKVAGSDLAMFAAGTLTIADNLNLSSLYASAYNILLGGGGSSQIVTAGSQIYYGPVTLAADTTLTGTSFYLLDTLTGGGKNLTLNNSATATLGGAVSGVNTLTASGSGDLVVNNTISAASVNDSEATALNGDSVTTTGDQIYNGAVTLGGTGTTRTLSGANVNLAGTLTGGGMNLTVNSSGTTTFGNAVSGVNALTTDAGGKTVVSGSISAGSVTLNDLAALNNDVTTTAGQTYNGTVTLGGAGPTRTMTDTAGGNIAFNNQVTGAGKSLTANTAGTTTFGISVSGINALTTDTSGNTVVNGSVSASSVTLNDSAALNNNVTTTGDQIYNGAVTLGGANESRTLSGANVNLAGTVIGGGKNLVVNSAGTTTFGNTVSGVNALTTDAGGNTVVNGSISASSVTLNDSAALNNDVTTTAGQTYYGAVTLGGAGATRTVTDTAGGNIAFNNTVTGAGKSLTANTAGTTTFNTTVSGVNALTTDAGGKTVVNGPVSASSVTLNDPAAVNNDVTTTAGQTYRGEVTLGGAGTTRTLSGVDVNLAGTVNGAGKNLIVNDSGTTTFGNTVSGIASLTTDAPGTTALNGGSVTTTGRQTYNDDVVLGANTTLSSTTPGGSGVAFGKTVRGATDAAESLTVNAEKTTFSGPVGDNNQRLASLTTDAGGVTELNGGSVTTSGAQTYHDPVTLSGSGSTALTGGSVTFDKTVRSATDGQQSLIVNAGTTTFGGAVGDNNQRLVRLSTDASGTTALNGGSVTTTGGQSYGDDITLGAATVLTSSGGSASFAKTVNGAQTLTVNTLGVTFGGAVGNNAPLASLTTSAAGPTALFGGSVKTTGAQTYNGSVTLGAATTLTSSGGADITFADTINGAQTLAVNTSGNEIFNGAVGGSAALTSLTTDGSATIGGQAKLNGGTVTTTGDQTYNDNILLGANTTLNGANLSLAGTVTGGGNNLTLNNSGTATLGGALSGVNALTASGGGNLVVNNTISAASVSDAETTALNSGTVTTTGAQTYNGAVTLGANTTLTSSGAGDIDLAQTVDGAQTLAVNTAGKTTFGGAVGGGTALTSLTTDAPGTTALNGGTINAATVDFKDDVTVGANTVLNGVTATFEKTVTGLNTITVAGRVITSISSLTLNNSGTATFNGAVNTVGFLTANGSGNLVVNNTISAGAFNDSEVTALNGGLVTASSQTYNQDVTLGADTTLNAPTTVTSTTIAGGRTITSITPGEITFLHAVDGAHSLTLNVGDTTTFGGAVGNNQALTSLTTDAAGMTALNGGTIKTTGAQTYNDAVTLGAGTTLTSSAGDITFAQTVDGAQSLAVNTSGNEIFNGAIGSSTALTSLTTDGSGTVGGQAQLNGGTVTTSGAQTYNDSVLLGANATLIGTAISLPGTVTGGGNNLSLNNSGTATLGGALSGVNALTAIGSGNLVVNNTVSASSVNDSEPTALNGGTVTTTGTQTYNGAVTLGAATTLTSTGAGAAGDINLANTVDGTQTLAVNTAGTTTFGGVVGGGTALTSLTTDAPGTTALNGGIVRTADGQTYNDDLTLGAGTTLTSSGGADITFAKTINGAQTLAVNTAGTTTFGGIVGGGTALTSLTTDAAGTTALNGGTVNATMVNFKDDVTLGANTIFNGTTANFEKTINASLPISALMPNGRVIASTADLTFNESATVTFGGMVSGIHSLTVNATTIDFKDDVDLTSTTTTTLPGGRMFTSPSGGNLTLNNSGTARFDGTVSGVNALTASGSGNLVVNDTISANSVNDSEATALNGGLVTAGLQTYNGTVTLGVDTTMTALSTLTTVTLSGGRTVTSIGPGNISLLQTVDGAHSLTLDVAGTTTFGGAVGNNQALTSLTTDAAGTIALNGGSVTTTGGQTYNDNVLLGAATTLRSSGGADITFAGTINGAQTLAVNTSGNEIFNGTVGDTAPLTSLTTDGSGTVGGQAQLNGGLVATTGGQTYNDNVLLGTATTLTSSGGANITFAKAIDGAQTLAVNTSGNEIFNGAVGGGTALTSLTTDGAGTVGGGAFLNGGSVTTVGSQTYNDNVTLGADTTLTGSALTFAGTVAGGGKSLTLKNSGTATLGGALSGVDALTASGTGNLVVNRTISAGSLLDLETTRLNGGVVATTAGQTYGNIVTLGADTILYLNNFTLSGNGAFSGNGYSLTVNGVTYTVVGQNETLKRSILGAILPTYQPIEVRARKPWLHKRQNMPAWTITDPMNSLQVPFD